MIATSRVAPGDELKATRVPTMTPHHTQALALAKAERWEEAHRLIQAYDDELARLIHGYLHRIEGDLSNAAYWYRRAGCQLPDNTLDEEHQRLLALLESR